MYNQTERKLHFRWMGCLLIGMCLMMGLGACSQQEEENNSVIDGPASDPEMQGTITFLTNRVDLIENGTMRRYAEAFSEKYPGATVQFEGLTNYADDIIARLTMRDLGDALLIPKNLTNRELPNYFEPLDPAMMENMRFTDHRMHEGQNYGLATGSSIEGIIYNKRAFAAAGIEEVPRTLDEFYAACEQLKQAGIVPVYLNYGAQWPMKQWGEELVVFMNEDPNYVNNMINQPEPWQLDNAWGRSIMIAKTLINRGYVEDRLFADYWEISKTEVATGEAAMYFLGNWVINQVVAAGANSEDIGFFPFPYDNSGNYYAPVNPDWFVGVSKFSEHKKLAKAWIDFLVKESGYIADSGFLPVIKGEEAAFPQIQEFLSYEPTLVESVPVSDTLLEIANRAQIAFWSGEYVQELVASRDLAASFEAINQRWKRAREEVLELPVQ
ncbi:ABC transporter substrate-binding protein [Marinicrinis sediminis]|uniref:ABC transporter substrate-binding protein n=1 Tax=Marinicrinis sediminis TaxID=1652465 RepID=A0ABW5R7A2_9BACL